MGCGAGYAVLDIARPYEAAKRARNRGATLSFAKSVRPDRALDGDFTGPGPSAPERAYARRNARAASGTNTINSPASQATVPSAGPSASPSPIISARLAFTHSVTGLMSANHCSAAGIESVGTNAEEMNVSGKTQMKPTDCAASGFFTSRPTNALIHENT